MAISLELTIDSHRYGTDVYSVHERRPETGPRTWQVNYRCEGYQLNPGQESQTSTNWELSGEAADAFEAKLASLSIRACPEFIAGLDGTTTTLRIEHGFNCITLCWWEEPPRAWQDVRGLLAQLLASRPGRVTGGVE